MPTVTVCRPAGDEFFQLLTMRIDLLHELAHVWHWQQGDGATWPDRSSIVGGTLDADEWEDRMQERVAVAVSWGLLDQLRRPVRSALSCAELYEQCVALTGHEPLGPLEPVCVPDPIEASATG